MATDFDLHRLLCDRPLAVHEDALAAINERMRMRIAGDELSGRREFAAAYGAQAMEQSLQRAGSIALIPIVGFLTDDPFLAWLGLGTAVDSIAFGVRQAVADPTVTGIVLVVNSPGGGVDLVQETAAEIRRARAVKPVVAIARTLCASAAFWLAAQADELIASPSAQIGSVGVFILHVSTERLNERVGITPTYIYAGKYKVEGNSDESLSSEARGFMQKRVDEIYATFVRDVALGRQTSDTHVRAQFGQGRVFGADEAVRLGMADRVETLEVLLGGLTTTGRQRQAQRMSRDRHALAEAMAAIDESECA